MASIVPAGPPPESCPRENRPGPGRLDVEHTGKDGNVALNAADWDVTAITKALDRFDVDDGQPIPDDVMAEDALVGG